MALKDLTIDKVKATEGAIEKVVKEYVHYDPQKLDLVPLHGFTGLRNEAKVLVSLVAMKGWRFVVEKPPDEALKPASLERITGIGGGTLRPILKRLKDDRLIAPRNNGYIVPDHNITKVGDLISAPGAASTAQTVKKVSPTRRYAKKATVKGAARRKEGPTAHVQALVSEGFFKVQKSLADVQKHLDVSGYRYPLTQLSGLMQLLVRKKQLRRQRVKDGKRGVYKYSNW